MSISFSVSGVNEIRYINEKEKQYAILEYNRLSSAIEVKKNGEDNSGLTFTSKDSPDKIEKFWMGLVQSSLDKKLRNLDEVINEMKKKFNKPKL
jgi:hypothetical protein